MRPETIAIHVPRRRTDGAVAPPIQLSTTYEHGPGGESLHDHEYVRSGNPNVDDLEARLAALEGGVGAIVYASGMAAASAMFDSLPAGATVVMHDTIYYDVTNLARTTMADRGLDVRGVDCRDVSALHEALGGGAALVWLETPTNPTLDLLDLRACCEAARAAGARTLVDGTFTTPALQRPFDFGADYVLHSTTKYIGGHSDVQGGALIVRDDETTLSALRRGRTLTGGVLAPFNAWLTQRGLQSLHCRMERQSASALALAAMLERHPAVEIVRYPLLPSSPTHALASSQMSGGGGVVSFDVRGGRVAAVAVAAAVRLFVNATSLGGVESLIEHRASIEGPASKAPPGLLRLSVGLEHPDDLIEDLARALDAA